jgi:hypothetical protein
MTKEERSTTLKSVPQPFRAFYLTGLAHPLEGINNLPTSLISARLASYRFCAGAFDVWAGLKFQLSRVCATEHEITFALKS